LPHRIYTVQGHIQQALIGGQGQLTLTCIQAMVNRALWFHQLIHRCLLANVAEIASNTVYNGVVNRFQVSVI